MIHTMLTKNEKDAIITFTPRGARVVELGCWLGGSTLCFLEKTTNVYTVDKFIWHDYMERRCPGYYAIGDTFLQAWLTNTHGKVPYNSRGVERYDRTTPIDVLFVDCWKHQSIMEATLKNVIPWLHQGSLIMDQDFFFNPKNYAYALLWYYRNRDHLEKVARADNMMVFRVLDCGFTYDLDGATCTELANAFDWCAHDL